MNALEACDLYTISREDFKKIMMESNEKKLDEYITFMDEVSVIKDLPLSHKRAVSQAMTEMTSRREACPCRG